MCPSNSRGVNTAFLAPLLRWDSRAGEMPPACLYRIDGGWVFGYDRGRLASAIKDGTPLYNPHGPSGETAGRGLLEEEP